jgi:hypothetical protein
MKHPRKSSPGWSPGCVTTDLLLEGSPRLAALLAAPALALPILLLASGLTYSVWASLGSVLLTAAAVPEWSRVCLCRGPLAPRRLRFTEEGQFRLDLTGGRSEIVSLAPQSVIAGPWLLLVLTSANTGGESVRKRPAPVRHRVVIDRAEVEPALFAALMRSVRRLASGPAGSRRALVSRIDPS